MEIEHSNPFEIQLPHERHALAFMSEAQTFVKQKYPHVKYYLLDLIDAEIKQGDEFSHYDPNDPQWDNPDVGVFDSGMIAKFIKDGEYADIESINQRRIECSLCGYDPSELQRIHQEILKIAANNYGEFLSEEIKRDALAIAFQAMYGSKAEDLVLWEHISEYVFKNTSIN